MGYTTPVETGETIKIYVSFSTGNDSNDGTINNPVKTLHEATERLRSGKPDWILLKRGDTWAETLGLYKTGDSNNTIVITTYGTGVRPLVRTIYGAYGSSGTNMSHMLIIGLKVYGNTEIHGFYHDLRFEDCFFSCVDDGFTHVSLNIDSFGATGGYRPYNMYLYRCIIADSVGDIAFPSTVSQGLFYAGVDGWTIEECIYDNNAIYAANIFSRHVYIHENCGYGTFIGNLGGRGRGDGEFQIRPGGTIINNLNLEPSVGILCGKPTDTPAAAINIIADNVVLYSKDVSAESPVGWGYDLQARTMIIKNNIAAFGTSSTASLDGMVISDCVSGVIMRNVVYNWNKAVNPSEEANGIRFYNYPATGSVIFAYNDIQQTTNGFVVVHPENVSPFPNLHFYNNHYYTTNTVLAPFHPNLSYNSWVTLAGDSGSLFGSRSYRDSARDLISYMNHFGITGDVSTPRNAVSSFMQLARTQTKENWNDLYTANSVNSYIREGFNLLKSDMDRGGGLNISDYIAFIHKYNQGDLLADMDYNNLLNINDYIEFNNKFRSGE